MVYGYENTLTILLALLGTIIVAIAQIRIKITYQKYLQIKSSNGLNGFDTARKILDQNGLNDILILETSGELTDHYDPTRKVIKLSHDIYSGETVASIAVAAHECGHAIQDKENYSFMRIRAALVPFVNFISSMGFIVILISLIAGITGYLMYGILMILVTLLFQIVTLPVEIDASRRAMQQLETFHITTMKEQNGARQVLIAAAMTYIASVLSSMLSLLRLIIMLNDRNDR
jgi:hypothetical protein